MGLQDSLRIRIMLVYSLSVVFLCILPAILREFAVPEASLWRVSCVVLAGTAIVLFRAVIVPGSRDTMAREQRFESDPEIPL